MNKNNFSIDYEKIVNQLPSCAIVENFYTNVSKKYNAIWDTGAMCSAISQKVFKELKLARMGEITVNGVGGKNIVPIAAVNISFNDEIAFKKIGVTVCNFSSSIDILLGMDIITKGDFLLTNNKKTLLSFVLQ